MKEPNLSTALGHATPDRIVVRGHDLVEEVMGHMTFTETLYLLITGRRPTAAQVRIFDAALVTLMDHGVTSHAMVARMVYRTAPDSLQGAIAAGVLGVGGQFAGTMEGAAVVIQKVAAAPSPQAAEQEAEAIVNEHRRRKAHVAGLGHTFHHPDDPRSPRLFAIAAEAGVDGRYIAALQLLSKTADRILERHLTINATGAIAAVLLEIGIPAGIARGIAVVSRAAGLVAQLNEERQTPIAGPLSKLMSGAISYRNERATNEDDP